MRAAWLIAATLAAWGQAQPVGRIWTYSGTPAAGDCTAANYGHVAQDISGSTANIYDCKKSGGSAAWVLRSAGGGGGGDVYGGSTLLTAGIIPSVSSAGTIGPSKLSITGGVLTLLDDSVGTGDTSLVVQAGDSQASPLLLLKDNDGTPRHQTNFGGCVGSYWFGYLGLIGMSTDCGGGRNDIQSFDPTGEILYPFEFQASNTLISSVLTVDNGGDVTVYQPDALTGNTRLIVRAGDGQSTNLQEWRDPSNVTLAGITSTGDFTGTAAKATILATARAINGVSFDGSAAITITANLPADPAACSAGRYVTDTDSAGTLTCAQVAYSQVSGTPTLATVASSGSASDLSSGTLAAARGGAGTVSGILKANGTGGVSAAVSGTDYGTVSSVGWTGGIVSIANPTTTPAFTIAGTSGGIPYFSSSSTWATSSALAANTFVMGGGAGSAPTTGGGYGVTTAGSSGGTNYNEGTSTSLARADHQHTPAAVGSVTAVTVNTNTTGDQNLIQLTLPAGVLNAANRHTRFRAAGVYTTQTSQTPTVTLKAKLCTVSGCGSGTVITLATWTSAATTAAATNIPWNFDINLAGISTGASGTVEAHGSSNITLGTTASATTTTRNDTNTAASSAIDLTGTLYLQTTITFSTNATTANTATQRLASLNFMN